MPSPKSWRLSYPGTDLSFGGFADVATFGEAPELGTVDTDTDDTRLPRSDGRAFGVDFFGGRTITFPSLLVGGTDGDDVAAKVARLTSAWRADVVRSTPGAVAQLRIPNPAGDRVVFGRPRRFARDDAHSPNGLAFVSADFACSSPDFYSAAESVETVNFAPSLGGGLVGPLTAPLTTTAGADRRTTITVSTDLPAWPRVTIHGPITNPEVTVLGAFRFALLATLAYDDEVTFDAAPWARSITRANGTSASGLASRSSTRLSASAMPAGSYDVALRGQDVTGTSWARVSWRSRFSSI